MVLIQKLIHTLYKFIIYCKDDFLIILCFRFNTEDVGGFIFTDQLLQVSARLPSHTLYGLGYQRNDLQLDMNWRLITLFNRDQEPSDKVCLFYIAISLVYVVFGTTKYLLVGM